MENIEKMLVDKAPAYEINSPHGKNINVLMLALSTFAFNKDKTSKDEDIPSFKVDSSTPFLFNGESYIGRYQLDPVPKILSKLLNERGERLDYIIAFCSTNQDAEGQLQPAKVETKTRVLIPVEGENGETYAEFSISPLEYFRKQIGMYIPQDEERVIPIRIAEEDQAGGIEKAITFIRSLNEKGEVHLHLDSHGGFRDAALALQAVISLLGKDEITIDNSFSVKRGPNTVTLDKSMEMFDFASGINEFTNYGRLVSLKEFVEKRSLDKIGEIKELMSILELISDSISICDTQKFEKGLTELTQYYQDIRTSSNLGYLAIFMKTIENDFDDLLSPDRDVVDEIKWCLKKEYYQQALTLIESRMPGEFVRNGLRYYCDTKNRERAVQIFNEYYSMVKDYEKYKVENPAHFFLKYYQVIRKNNKPIKNLIALQHNNDTSYLLNRRSRFQNKEAINRLIGDKNIETSYFGLCAMRNMINHGAKVDITVSQLKNAISTFIKDYEAILASPHNDNSIAEVYFDKENRRFI